MVTIFSRYETTYCCLLVPWVFRYLCMWQGGPAAAWPHRTTGDWPEDSLPLSPPEKEVVHRLVDGYNFPPLLSNIGLTLPPLLIMFLVSTNKSISLVWILKLRKCNSGEYQIFHIYRWLHLLGKIRTTFLHPWWAQGAKLSFGKDYIGLPECLLNPGRSLLSRFRKKCVVCLVRRSFKGQLEGPMDILVFWDWRRGIRF